MVEHMATPEMILYFVPNVDVTLPISGIGPEGIQVDFNNGNGPQTFTQGATVSGTTNDGDGRVDITGIFTTFGLGDQPWSSSSALLNVGGDLLPSVTSLAGAFHGAINFIGSGLPGWDVTNVTDMSYMLAGTFTYDMQAAVNLGVWNTQNVKNMAYMFCGAAYFVDETELGVDLWNVSAVSDMSYMFEGTQFFNNTGLGNWQRISSPTSTVANVKSMAGMFNHSAAFIGVGLQFWNVSGVTDMTNMFNHATSFNNEELNQWTPSAVTSMAGMFYKADGMYNLGNLKPDLNVWQVGAVKNHNLFLSSDGTQDTSVSDLHSPFSIEGAEPTIPFTMHTVTGPLSVTDWTNTVEYPAATRINVILIGQGGGGATVAGGNAAGIQFNYTFSGPVDISSIVIHKGTTAAAGTNGDKSSITFTDIGNTYEITAGGGLSDGNGGIITFSVTVGGNTTVITGTLTSYNPAFNILAQGAGTNGDAQNIMNGYQAGGGTDFELYGAGIGGAPGEFGASGEIILNLDLPLTLPISGIDASGLMIDTGLAQTPYATGDSIDIFISGPINIFGNFSKFGNGATKWPGSTLIETFTNWGSARLLDVSGAFNGASSLTTIPTASPPSSITDMSYMFSDASGLYDVSGRLLNDIEWNVDYVTNSAFFVSSKGIDTTRTDVKSPFFTPAPPAVLLPPAMTLRFSSVTDVTLPISGIDASGLIVNWNDGRGYLTYTNGSTISGTTDQVDVSGSFTSFGLGSESWPGATALIDVSGYPRGLTDLSGAFNGASQFIGSDLHTWDVSGVTDMSHMFYFASAFNNNLGSWVTSKVKDMSHMFEVADAFDGTGIDAWNVSAVTNMDSMFSAALAFNNVNLGAWQRSAPTTSTVANVRNMSNMFNSAGAYAGATINLWDVSGVTDMSNMFLFAYVFNNTGLGSWNVSNVKNMSKMFNNSAFTGVGIDAWNVSAVTDMTSMFDTAVNFNNTTLGAWERSTPTTSTVANVRTMDHMFYNATAFTGDSIQTWNVSGVSDMQYMFADTSFNNVSLGSWNTSNVRNMANMFDSATVFTGASIQDWNVSNVSDMTAMFNNATVFNNSQLSNWERTTPSVSTLASVQSMERMFLAALGMYDASGGFKYNIDNWNVSNVTSNSFMMVGTGVDSTTTDPNSPFYSPVITPDLSLKFDISGIDVTLPLSGVDASGVQVNWYDGSGYITYSQAAANAGISRTTVAEKVDIVGNFTSFGNGTSPWEGAVHLSQVTFNSNTITDLSGAFNRISGTFQTPSIPTSVTDLSHLFANATGSPEVGSWDVSNVTNMAGMFFQAANYASQYTDDLSNWNVRKVKDMNRMFSGTFSDLSGLDVWQPVACTNMTQMFFNTSQPILNLSGWANYLNPSVTYSGFYTNAADISGSPLSPFYVGSSEPPVIPSRSPMILSVDVSGSRAFSLPITGISGDLVVDWGDGSVSQHTTGLVAHTDVSGAPHQIKVYGDFTGFGSFGWAGLHNVTSVNSWGDNVLLRSLDFAFKGATRLVSVPTLPATVVSLNSTFAASTFNGDISGWLMTNVTDVTSMLADASGFTRNLTNWAYSLAPNVLNTNFFTVGTYGCSALTNPVADSQNSPFYALIPAPPNTLFTSIASFTAEPNPFYQLGSTIYGTAGTTLFSINTNGNSYSPLTTLTGTPIGSLVGNSTFGPTIFGIVTGSPSALFYYDPSMNIIGSAPTVGTFLGTPNPNMAFDASGNLYATDSTGSIYKVVPSTLVSSTQTLTAITTTSPAIVGPLYVSNNILTGSSASGALVSLNLATLAVTVTQPISNALPSSCLAQAGNVYFYDVSGNSLNMYTISTNQTTQLWDFSGNPLKGTNPIDQISIDFIAQKLYGLCETGGPGLGNGTRGGGTVWSFQLPSGPMTVLNSYVLGDTTRGSTPVSYSITDMVTSGTANVVTQGGGANPYFKVRLVTYQLGQVILPGYTSCFNHGTKILRMVHGADTWSPIETLRRGDLIKTYKHGYRAITNIGKGIMINNPEVWHSCMYQSQKEGHEPLIVTGGHGFLVDNLTLDEQEAQSVFWGRGEEVIDDKILMVAPACKDFKAILDTEVYTYYHFTVENDGDNDRRYGVYANGFLTETPSVNQYKQHKYHSL